MISFPNHHRYVLISYTENGRIARCIWDGFMAKNWRNIGLNLLTDFVDILPISPPKIMSFDRDIMNLSIAWFVCPSQLSDFPTPQHLVVGYFGPDPFTDFRLPTPRFHFSFGNHKISRPSVLKIPVTWKNKVQKFSTFSKIITFWLSTSCHRCVHFQVFRISEVLYTFRQCSRFNHSCILEFQDIQACW